MSLTEDVCIKTSKLLQHWFALQILSGTLVLHSLHANCVVIAKSLAVIFHFAFLAFVSAVLYLRVVALVFVLSVLLEQSLVSSCADVEHLVGTLVAESCSLALVLDALEVVAEYRSLLTVYKLKLRMLCVNAKCSLRSCLCFKE